MPNSKQLSGHVYLCFFLLSLWVCFSFLFNFGKLIRTPPPQCRFILSLFSSGFPAVCLILFLPHHVCHLSSVLSSFLSLHGISLFSLGHHPPLPSFIAIHFLVVSSSSCLLLISKMKPLHKFVACKCHKVQNSSPPPPLPSYNYDCNPHQSQLAATVLSLFAPSVTPQ